MYFSIYNILPVAYAAFAVLSLAMLWLLLCYRRRVASVSTAAREADAALPAGGTLPPVSVIVYASYNAGDLEETLPLILAQEYPGEFEVIVVNDGSSSELSDVVKRYAHDYPNLYQTFVPEKAHNLSRKKLAISLGIKAARTDYVVLTEACGRPRSRRWLQLMARHFASGKEVVLGWGRISGLKSAMKAFDQVATGTTWLAAALAGNPYRGTALNIGYSRRLFFEAKGFSRTLNLHHGDDDLFVNQIATAENTAVELSPAARISARAENPAAMWREEKLRHAFTARMLPKGARRFMGFSTTMMWAWVVSAVVCVVFTIPNLLPGCVVLALCAALWIPLTMAWRRTGKALGVRLRPVILWWMMLWRWIPDLRARLRCASAERRNYTWLQK